MPKVKVIYTVNGSCKWLQLEVIITFVILWFVYDSNSLD